MRNSGLSKKRKELLALIDKHGIMTRKQIEEYMDIASINIFKGTKKLEELGYIQTYPLARGYAHYVTRAGSQYIGMINFGYVKSGGIPNLAILEHNLLVNECILQAIESVKDYFGEDKEITYITEREQLADSMLAIDFSHRNAREKQKAKMIMRNKIPDFLLKYEGKNNPVTNAYEVELSRKGNKALKGKLLWYKQEQEKKTYTNVWYMYEKETIRNYVTTNAKAVHYGVNFLEIKKT